MQLDLHMVREDEDFDGIATSRNNYDRAFNHAKNSTPDEALYKEVIASELPGMLDGLASNEAISSEMLGKLIAHKVSNGLEGVILWGAELSNPNITLEQTVYFIDELDVENDNFALICKHLLKNPHLTDELFESFYAKIPPAPKLPLESSSDQASRWGLNIRPVGNEYPVKLEKPYGYFYSYLAMSPNTPKAIREDVYRNFIPYIPLDSIKVVHDDLIDAVLASHSSKAWTTLASNFSLTAENLSAISVKLIERDNSEIGFDNENIVTKVAIRIANHHSLDSELIQHIYFSGQFENALEEFHDSDYDSEILAPMVANPNAPAIVLSSIWESKVAEKPFTAQSMFTQNASEKTRIQNLFIRAFAENPSLPLSFIEKLLNKMDSQTWINLSANRGIPESIVSRLIKESWLLTDYHIVEEILANCYKHYSVDIMDFYDAIEAMTVAYRKDTYAKAYQSINDKSGGEFLSKMKNELVSQEIVDESLLEVPDSWIFKLLNWEPA